MKSEKGTAAGLPDLYEASLAELQDGLTKGQFTSVDLVKAYLARIDEVNIKGPALHAVIETSPVVLAQAAALDEERKAKGVRGPLHGIPILLKDNIATQASDGMQTTAGSFALLGSIPPRPATIARKLTSAGALLLGKANMSEWANFRGNRVPSGFSARGGQTTCPYFPHADPSGSSSGSGVAPAIGLCAAALGTETDGSIVSPSSRNNVVGVKPTVGLTSRAGVIPISTNQDTVGPMARSVADAAALLTVIAGPDPLDVRTLSQPAPVPSFSDALQRDGLRGARLGVPRLLQGEDKNVVAAFDGALEVIRGLGATVVDGAELPGTAQLLVSKHEMVVLRTDFRFEVEEYIAGLSEVPTGVKNLEDLIAFNEAHAEQELIPPYYTDQSRFKRSVQHEKDDGYRAALDMSDDLGRVRGIDGVLKEHNLDAIILPADRWACEVAAIAGYPIVSVPLGYQPDDVTPTPAEPIIKNAPGLPFGLAFIGTAYSDFNLIKYAYAFEQATLTRLKKRAYPAAIPKTQLADVIEKDESARRSRL
ncbi:amidase signature enzyme [Dentipellis sp. KUC8613]|nr:amidase signature enzyme [Dentipellis sp. KUC8613]